MTSYKKIIGKNLTAYMKERNLSYKDVSEMTGMSLTSIWHWANGLTEPGAGNLYWLAQVFDEPMEDFFNDKTDYSGGF